MTLRSSILPAALGGLLALAAPAAAQSRPHHRAGDMLGDRAMQEDMGDMAAVMAETLLDLPVGRFADAMARMGDPDAAMIDPDARLGDLAGPDARDLPRTLARETPRMMGAMAGMADAMDDMIPQFAAMAERMRGAMDRAGRDYDRRR